MNRKQLIIGAGTLLGLASLVFAHHVPVGLSHVAGMEILKEVVFFTSPLNYGLPAYQVGTEEVPGHHDPVGIAAGDSFTVLDQSGNSETIVFEAADFTDISHAVMEDVVAVINAKATIFEAIETNGYLVLQGHSGGSSGALKVQNGHGAPLAKMGMLDEFVIGGDSIQLTLSIPDPNLDLAGKPYVVMASATDGSFLMQGQTIPIGRDGLFTAFRNAVQSGALPGFRGVLDANSDARATLAGRQLRQGFGANFPDKMYFTYVVYDTPGHIAYVSNRFTVDFR